jgi:hypothetical protein
VTSWRHGLQCWAAIDTTVQLLSSFFRNDAPSCESQVEFLNEQNHFKQASTGVSYTASTNPTVHSSPKGIVT